MSALLDRMKSLMEKEGVKAKQITAELGISNSSFTDWNKGKGSPSLDTLVKFANRFHVSLDYLVYGTDFFSKTLEYSNPKDNELIAKFHQLSPELQSKLLGYLDGMLAVTQQAAHEEKRLSV